MIPLRASYSNFGGCIGFWTLTGGGDDVIGYEIDYIVSLTPYQTFRHARDSKSRRTS